MASGQISQAEQKRRSKARLALEIAAATLENYGRDSTLIEALRAEAEDIYKNGSTAAP